MKPTRFFIMLLCSMLCFGARAQEYVDLGLPSGICWATRNLGATSDGSKGNYYQWGWTNADYDCNYSYSGPLENGRLPLQNDAAYVQKGAPWRMPTLDEWNELVSYTTQSTRKVGDTKWLRFTSKVYTNRYIDIPAAGYRYAANGIAAGNTDFSYWLSDTHNNKYPFYATYLFDECWVGYSTQYYGQPIRPVYCGLRKLTLNPVNAVVKEQVQVTYNTTPVCAMCGTLTWSVDDPTIASVDANGKVTGLKIGHTKLRATCNGIPAETIISVNYPSGDLGLSVRWATKNIGANSPGETGNVYTWDGAVGTTQDIVTQTLGDGWRMPTKDEWQELINSCNWTSTFVNGKLCIIGEPKNEKYSGHRIYLPSNSDNDCCYWTGTATWDSEYSYMAQWKNRKWGLPSLHKDAYLPVRGVLAFRTCPMFAIDMGNGLYWADANIGAISNYDPGTFYAWGDLSGSGNGGHTFNWERYTYCDGSYNNLTRYNNLTTMGTVDGLQTLDSNDDIAGALGDGWRMPTPAEVATLEDTTLYIWTWYDADNNDYYGHAGYKVTSRANGNSIFLPATGYYVSNHIEGKNQIGAYWTNTRSAEIPYMAETMCFDLVSQCAGYGMRCEGRVIRAVKTIQ